MISSVDLRVLHMTVAEFKALKRAIRVLIAAGVSYDTAADLLLDLR